MLLTTEANSPALDLVFELWEYTVAISSNFPWQPEKKVVMRQTEIVNMVGECPRTWPLIQ